ncbi:MAG: PIN domain-containing protein [Armatimonadota bacterium]|nr:PIN domain-containing protein [Armatimonadota bacterium]
MKFWDSSALLSLLTSQSDASDVEGVFRQDTQVVVWWGTRVELVSGACRLVRESAGDDSVLTELLARIDRTVSEADEVEPAEHVRAAAIRVLRLHVLRAADALQLAAALVWTEHNPAGDGFVCLDKRLREAAAKEGFACLPRELKGG